MTNAIGESFWDETGILIRSDLKMPSENETVSVCVVTRNASSDELEIFVSITLDGEADPTSYLTLEATHDDTELAKAACVNHNGSGHEGGIGLCVADSGSEIHDFLETVIEYSDEDLDHYVEQVSALEYECARHSGESPVADLACPKCEKNGVSFDGNFLPIGKCCYYGYLHLHTRRRALAWTDPVAAAFGRYGCRSGKRNTKKRTAPGRTSSDSRLNETEYI